METVPYTCSCTVYCTCYVVLELYIHVHVSLHGCRAIGTLHRTWRSSNLHCISAQSIDILFLGWVSKCIHVHAPALCTMFMYLFALKHMGVLKIGYIHVQCSLHVYRTVHVFELVILAVL